ncbi:MAG TPA: TetR/AcrR family transcriptional regulator [bacterium]|nr:TetR/AcrR family transcriptional regulator [bacterium]
MRGPGPDTSYAAFERRLRPLADELFLTMIRENVDRIKAPADAGAARKLGSIFRAALSLSLEKGFTAISLGEIAAGAGLSEDELGSYLSGKDDLRSYVLRYGSSFVARMIMAETEGQETARAQLGAAVRTHVYLSEALREWFYFAYMEAKNLDPEERRMAMANEKLTETLFVGILRRGQEGGEFWLRDLDLTAAALKAMLQDWYLKRWKYRKLSTSVEAYAEFVMNFVMDAIAEE